MEEKTVQEVLQAVLQATQAAQEAAQSAQQIAQSVSQNVSDLKNTVTASRVEQGDIGGSERLEKDQMSDSGLLFANAKRTYDEYQNESLESIKRNRSYVDLVLSNAQTSNMTKENIANQALQNAVETANLVGKQAVAHRDIAIDRVWNIDEVSGLSAKSGVQSDLVQMIATATAAAVVAAMAEQKKA